MHVGLPASEHHRCAEMVNKPHIRAVLADGDAPGHPVSLHEHPMSGLSTALGFVPDDEVGSADLGAWRSVEFPATNAHVSALGMSTFYNALAQEKLLTHEHVERCRVSQGGREADVVLGPRVADHGWGVPAGASPRARWSTSRNPRVLADGRPGHRQPERTSMAGLSIALGLYRRRGGSADSGWRSVDFRHQVMSALGM